MLKIQLDHKALIALLESAGPEFEVELRRGVLESACRKTVKAIVGKEVRDDIKRIVADQLGKVDYRGNVTLSDKLRKVVQTAAEAPILDAVTEAVQPNLIKAQVKEAIAETVTRLEINIAVMVAKQLNEHIAQHIDAQVKERLALLMKGGA